MIPALLGAMIVVGHAVRRLAGLPPDPAASAPIGCAALLLLSPAAIRLPGHGATAGAALVLLTAAALVFVRGRVWRLADLGLVSGVVLAAVSVPFIANWRFGPLGVTVNNDLGPHFAWADALRTGNHRLWETIIDGYPVGPHAFAAGLGTLFGTDVERPFAAILMATPILTGISALGFLWPLARSRRVLGAAMTGVAYMPIAYFGQGAFKEPLVAMFLLAFVLALRETFPWESSPRHTLPAAVLAGGSISAYGFSGLYPLVAAGALAFLGVLVLRPPRAWGPAVRQLAVGTAAAGCVLALLVLPQLPRLIHFSPVEAAVPSPTNAFGGNLVGKLSGYQALGIWRSGEFRLPSPDTFHAGMLAAFALAVAIYGSLFLLRRRDPFLPAGALAATAIYLYIDRTELPYISAKVLVIASPVLMLISVGALLYAVEEARRGPADRLVHAAIAAIFITAAASSSWLVLRDVRVGPLDHANELKSVRGLVEGEPTLFLGQDDFAQWELQGAILSSPYVYAIESQLPSEVRPEKPLIPGGTLDFDTVTSESLDGYHFVIVPRTAYASAAPSNWRRAASTASYEVWERSGPTTPRSVLPEGSSPGVVMTCGDPQFRRLARSPGEASVRPAPVFASEAWTTSEGPPYVDELAYAHVPVDATSTRSLVLAPGRWDVSLQYTSDLELTLRAPGFTGRLRPNLDRRGPYWSLGTYTSTGGRTTFEATAEQVPVRIGRRDVALGVLVATPLDVPERTIPLARSCRRYVDWYRER